MLAVKVRSSFIHKNLVNPSCNPELVPHMLAAKVRSSLILKILKSISCSAEIVRHILAVKENLSKSDTYMNYNPLHCVI